MKRLLLGIVIGGLTGAGLAVLVMKAIEEIREVWRWDVAAISLPGIGTATGPCENEQCEHLICVTTREMAAMKCTECGEPIGYDTPFFQGQGDHDLIHALCR